MLADWVRRFRGGVIFADVDDREVVQHVWFRLIGAEPSVHRPLRASFEAIEHGHQLLFVDWGWGEDFAPSEDASIDVYLSRLFRDQ